MSTRNERFVTDAGAAVYPRLNQPDTKFDAAGVYSVKLRIAPDAMIRTQKGEPVETVETFLSNRHNAALEKAKKENKGKKVREGAEPWQVDEDTGDLLVNFKLKASGTRKDGSAFTQSPALFDAKGRPLAKDKIIFGGSKLKVCFEANPYYVAAVGASISLRLKAVQVLELAQGGGNAEAYGFGAEEGFEDDEEETFETANTTTEDDDEDF